MENALAPIETEKRLLSALMIDDGSAIPEAVSLGLRVADFYRVEHRLIYDSMLRLNNAGVGVDVLTLEEELRKRNELNKVTRLYLYSLVEQEYTTLRVSRYINVVKEKSQLRQMIELGERLVAAAQAGQKSVPELLEGLERRVLQIRQTRRTGGFDGITGILTDAFEMISNISDNRGELYGVPSGLLDLDKVLNGFQKSDLILLAARPSMGKTALALNIGINAAGRGNVVGLFSLEMSKLQLGKRILSTVSKVDSQYLNTGNLTDADFEYILDAIKKLEDYRVYIDDTAGLSLMEMRNKARRLKQEHGLDMLIIDYLQLMSGTVRVENRQQEISEISRGLKALARELEVPIIALSQLSRNVELRAEKKPQLSDLRESGSLEQDADIVMFLYRDEYYNRDEEDNQNIAELIIAKNRNGPTVSVPLQFDKATMSFRDLVRLN